MLLLYLLILTLGYTPPRVTPAAPAPGTGVIINATDCRDSESHFSINDIPELKIYHLPDHRLAWQRPDTVRYLPYDLWITESGNYVARYENIFGQQMEKEFAVVQGRVDHVMLCLDEAANYDHHTMDRLKDGQALEIECVASGCFNYSINRLVLKRQASEITASLYIIAWHEDSLYHIVRDSSLLLKVTTLSPHQLADFRRFENELRLVRAGGCTSTDRYRISSPLWRGAYVDGNCDWEGFGHLILSFFGEIDYDILPSND